MHVNRVCTDICKNIKNLYISLYKYLHIYIQLYRCIYVYVGCKMQKNTWYSQTWREQSNPPSVLGCWVPLQFPRQKVWLQLLAPGPQQGCIRFRTLLQCVNSIPSEGCHNDDTNICVVLRSATTPPVSQVKKTPIYHMISYEYKLNPNDHGLRPVSKFKKSGRNQGKNDQKAVSQQQKKSEVSLWHPW